jgi:predicted nucleic acid-binding protein
LPFQGNDKKSGNAVLCLSTAIWKNIEPRDSLESNERRRTPQQSWRGIQNNKALLAEYEKYAQELEAEYVFVYLKSRIILTDQSEDEVHRCKPFFPESQASDVVHAATCLHTAAVLITTDKHFDKIRDAGLIRVWSISEAINNLL